MGDIQTPYQIRSVASMNVAIVGLVSQTHGQEIPAVGLIPPQTALTSLKTELDNKSDFVVVVFHASQEEAQALAETVQWIDILIIVSDQQTKIMDRGTDPITIGNTTVVTNATQGAAIGVLEFGDELQTRQIPVSEAIQPNPELSKVLALYHQLSETAELEHDGSTEKARAVHITYFHKQGCQKCERAVEILKTLKVKYPQVVVEKRSAKEEQALLEAMGVLY